MYASVIHFSHLDVYARRIYYFGMEPEVAKYHFGALALGRRKHRQRLGLAFTQRLRDRDDDISEFGAWASNQCSSDPD